MNIEKALSNYLQRKGPKISDRDFCTYVENTDKDIVNVIFKLINDEIDTIDEKKELDRVVEVIRLLELIMSNGAEVKRKVVSRKIKKLNEKMDRIMLENRSKFSNPKKINSEFNKVRRALDSLGEINEAEDSKQFSFMKFLIEETRNVTYLEYTLKKMPSLANVRDKEEVSLFRNLIIRYLQCIMEENEEDTLYFKNLITLLRTQRSFTLTEQEKKKCLEEVYKMLDKMNITKRAQKSNSKKIAQLSKLVEYLKGSTNEKKDVQSVASKYNIEVFFNPNVLEKAKLTGESKEGEMTGREVVDDYVISIDGPGAIEIDDGVSCKKLPNGNYLLGVHIASVLGHFDYDSDIVQQAIERGQSIYLSTKYQQKKDDYESVIPLFPYSFSADKGSLLENEPRLARSYYFEIDKDGNIVNERFKKSIVRNNKQLTYNDVNRIIEKGTSDPQLAEVIDNLQEVTARIEKRFSVDSLYEMIKENTDEYSSLRVGASKSENIIYRAMLLTGTRVAEYFSKMNLPMIYRVHYIDEDKNQKIRDMLDTLNKTYGTDSFKNLYQLIEGVYPKGWYQNEGRHSGLDLDHYCHCTSPLRRAPDIVVEHLLEECYDKTPTEEEIEKLREEVASKIVEINSKISIIDYFVKEYRKKNRH